MTTQATNCIYNDETSISDNGCNNCFESERCSSINDCVSVCGLDGVNTGICGNDDEDECDERESRDIVDLYRTLFFQIKSYIRQNDSLPNLDIKFNTFKTLGADSTKDQIKNLLVSMYNSGTLNSKSNFVDKQRLDNIIKSQELIITDDGILLNNLKNVDNTSKRQMEININEFRKVEYNLGVIKQAVVFVAIMLLIPALVKFNVLDKKTGMVIWMVLLVVILVYVCFMIMVKNNNRDDIDFKQYNFVKPTDDEIARSRIEASMSSKDKARCKALAQMDDDFDPESINIDITPYRTNEGSSQRRCFSNQ